MTFFEFYGVLLRVQWPETITLHLVMPEKDLRRELGDLLAESEERLHKLIRVVLKRELWPEFLTGINKRQLRSNLPVLAYCPTRAMTRCFSKASSRWTWDQQP